jgi:hypothetical protein
LIGGTVRRNSVNHRKLLGDAEGCAESLVRGGCLQAQLSNKSILHHSIIQSSNAYLLSYGADSAVGAVMALPCDPN